MASDGDGSATEAVEMVMVNARAAAARAMAPAARAMAIAAVATTRAVVARARAVVARAKGRWCARGRSGAVGQCVNFIETSFSAGHFLSK